MNRSELLAELQARLSAESHAALVADFVAADRAGDDAPWLHRLAQAAERLPLVEPPPALRQEVRDLFDPPLRTDLEAVMVFDSRTDRTLVGIRGDDAPGWSMVYTSEVADVAIDVWPLGPDAYDVDGHVMAHGGVSQGWRIRLVTTPGSEWVDADELGRFRLTDLGAISHGVVIESSRNRMVIGFDLGDPQ